MKVRVSLVLVIALIGALIATAVVIAALPATQDLKFGTLTGAKEHGGGDPDGVGTASGTIVDPDTLCYAFTAKNLGHPVAAHIHRGVASVNGPIVIPLSPPATGNPGTVAGCVTVNPHLLDQLRTHPDQFYWNLHTTEFPGGAIRGQVFTAP